MEKVSIRITLFHPPENEDIAKIHQIELSPPTFNGRVKYGIAGYEEQYSFDEFVNGKPKWPILAPELSVSAEGDVRSICLFCRFAFCGGISCLMANNDSGIISCGSDTTG